MTIDETMAYIHATEWQGSRPGLSRISTLCALLGNPQKKLRTIHIAGTNGKGSTSAMLASILQQEGYRVALFTSPYIYRFGERMQINGMPIPDEELCRVIEKIRPFVDEMEDRPTEFELITAAAFVYFAEAEVDYAVVEVGMGGRLDATNVLDAPLLSIITGIALDHTAYLGDTVEAIAKEKAGILKRGSSCVCGMLDEGAANVIFEIACSQDIYCGFADPAALRIRKVTPRGCNFSYRRRRRVHIPFAAAYQPRNAALVLDACDELRNRGVVLSERSIRRGLRRVQWPGRFEYFSHKPDVVFDGSHNPEGIAAAAESIKALYSERILLLSGVMRDKDFSSMTDTLAPMTDTVFCVRPDNPRAMDSAELAAVWQAKGVEAGAYKTVEDAMEAALAAAREKHLPLFILGSLYLYREARDAFDKAAKM